MGAWVGVCTGAVTVHARGGCTGSVAWASAYLVHLVVEELVLVAQLGDEPPGRVHPAPPPLVANAHEEVA